MKTVTAGPICLLNYELSMFPKQPGKFVWIVSPWDAS
jgi:hypothetical protein